MIRKVISTFFVFLIILLALFLAAKNSDTVTLYLSGQWQVTASLGVVAMGCFAFGVLLTSLIASYFTMRSYLRERQLLWRQRRAQEFWKQISRARGYYATGDHARASKMWRDLIASDPTNTIARTELAKVLLAKNEALEALQLLDEARSYDKNNLEVLMLAQQVNLQLGNRTAALDNLALLIQNHPTTYTVKLARDLAEQIDRPDEALRYHEMLYSLGERGDNYDTIKARLEFAKISPQLLNGNADSNRSAIKSFLKKHKDFPLALVRLAELEEANGDFSAAAKLLAEAANASKDSEHWYSAAKLWLKNNMPEAAISAAKNAVREANPETLLRVELDLIRLYIATGRLDEAESHLNDFSTLAAQNNLVASDEQAQSTLVLMGLCLNRRGKYKEASEIWRRLSKYDYEIPEIASDFKPFKNNEVKNSGRLAPSPTLSTP